MALPMTFTGAAPSLRPSINDAPTLACNHLSLTSGLRRGRCSGTERPCTQARRISPSAGSGLTAANAVPNHRPKKEPLMKIKLTSGLIAVLFILVGALRSAPLTTAFTYQGRLLDKGELATGSYDLHFALYSGSSVGTQTASPLTTASAALSTG